MHTTLLSVTTDYLLSRDLSRGWASQIEHRIKRLVEWLGGDPCCSALTHLEVNRWLMSLQETGLAPETVHGYRAAVHAVWMYAFQDGHTDTPPLRLRVIQRRPKLVRAYTREQLVELFRAAKKLPGRMEGMCVPRCVWWQAYIPTAYSTGLRRGCILSLEHSAIEQDGTCVVIAKKTGKLTARRLDAEALAGIAAIQTYEKSPLAFPSPRAKKSFFEDFKWIRETAGLPGTSKWIRRSAVSYAESQEQGKGRLLGGHSDERVTIRSYRDMTIAPPPVIEPPPIDWG